MFFGSVHLDQFFFASKVCGMMVLIFDPYRFYTQIFDLAIVDDELAILECQLVYL